MIEPVKYPVFQVRPNGLLIYEVTEWPYKRVKEKDTKITEDHNTTTTNNNRNTQFYTGQLTPYAKKKLKRAINLLVASSEWKEAEHFKTGKKFKFKVNFITLTLPAAQKDISDKDIKKYCFDNFVKRMKRKHKLHSYVWRAERQKNGNIHFHMITDCYIRYDYIRNDWNAVLQRYHFIDDFFAVHGHRNPNSTDVHAIQNIKNLAAYMVKYMSKETPSGDQIIGKVWDCSQNLKTKMRCESILTDEQEEIWEKALTIPGCYQMHEDRFSMICMNSDMVMDTLTGKTKSQWREYLAAVRSTTEHSMATEVPAVESPS